MKFMAEDFYSSTDTSDAFRKTFGLMESILIKEQLKALAPLIAEIANIRLAEMLQEDIECEKCGELIYCHDCVTRSMMECVKKLFWQD